MTDDGRPHTTPEEIQTALEAMEHPMFCAWCGEFRDQQSNECHECGSDETFNEDSLRYWLEVMTDEETRGAA